MVPVRTSRSTARATTTTEYSLALLLAASLEAGLPPVAWRESMAGLSRDHCRHGADAPGAAPS